MEITEEVSNVWGLSLVFCSRDISTGYILLAHTISITSLLRFSISMSFLLHRIVASLNVLWFRCAGILEIIARSLVICSQHQSMIACVILTNPREQAMVSSCKHFKRYACCTPYKLYPHYYTLCLSQYLDALDFTHSQTYIVEG